MKGIFKLFYKLDQKYFKNILRNIILQSFDNQLKSPKYLIVFVSVVMLSNTSLLAQNVNAKLFTQQKAALKKYNEGVARVLELNYTAALQSFDSAILLNPIFAKSYNERGKVYFTQNRISDAIMEFERASDLDSNLGEAYFNLAFSIFIQDIELIRNDSLTISSAAFGKAINKGYTKPHAYYYRGLMRCLEGQADSAASDFTIALELKPDYSKAYHDRGTAKVETGDFQGSIYDYRLAVTYQASLAQAYINMGTAKKRIGDYQGAERDFSVAIGLDSLNYRAFNNRGDVRYAMLNFDGAASDFQAAYLLFPDSPEIASNMGTVEHQKGNYESAIQWFNEALERNSKYAQAIVNRGLSYEMTGKLKEACADWQLASELGIEQAAVYLKECNE